MTTTSAPSLSAVAIPALLAALLGSFLIVGTGLSHLDALHNAAHDTRHAFAFPCH
jgi:cobalt transporter subunit CbtB